MGRNMYCVLIKEMSRNNDDALATMTEQVSSEKGCFPLRFMLNLLHAEFPTFKFATCLPNKYGVCYINWPSLLPNKNKNLEGNSFKTLELQRIYNVLVPSHFHLGKKCPLSVDLYLTNSYSYFCILNLGVNLQEQMRFTWIIQVRNFRLNWVY